MVDDGKSTIRGGGEAWKRTKLRFVLDHWAGEGALKDRFAEVYGIARKKKRTDAEPWSHNEEGGSWNLHLRPCIWDRPDVVWKLELQPKVKFFVWCLVWGMIQTRDRLRRKNIEVPTEYEICKEAPESILQLFFWCPLVRELWFQLVRGRVAEVWQLMEGNVGRYYRTGLEVEVML
ncbi:hypothetical protein FRX31_024965 [Thalictrum thalictroides]|uniref:Reverse transcriptase zinc-binding domain-containing protein n=1 Tax=Thalictrum thalictroides TaxID=46969 RepID=A0A7J6VLI4_THATH|nr:hypothetical protein FRX31_024965 [Thalictrum thalictroides]